MVSLQTLSNFRLWGGCLIFTTRGLQGRKAKESPEGRRLAPGVANLQKPWVEINQMPGEEREREEEEEEEIDIKTWSKEGQRDGKEDEQSSRPSFGLRSSRESAMLPSRLVSSTGAESICLERLAEGRGRFLARIY